MTAIAFGVFCVYLGFRETSLLDFSLALVGSVLLGVVAWIGKKHLPDVAPPIWALAVYVGVVGMAISLVGSTWFAFVLFGTYRVTTLTGKTR